MWRYFSAVALILFVVAPARAQFRVEPQLLAEIEMAAAKAQAAAAAIEPEKLRVDYRSGKAVAGMAAIVSRQASRLQSISRMMKASSELTNRELPGALVDQVALLLEVGHLRLDLRELDAQLLELPTFSDPSSQKNWNAWRAALFEAFKSVTSVDAKLESVVLGAVRLAEQRLLTCVK